MFSDCGAWKNFHDLEDSLTLEELGELYDIAVEKQNRFIQMMAAIQGVDLGDSSDVQSDRKKIPMSSDEAMRMMDNKFITSADDLTDFQYGLGYEVASSDG